MALVLITHDMGVVAETADRVIVQYAGQQGRGERDRALFADPHHPYTAALLAALPERATARRLPAIPGVVPGQFDRPRGCLFAPRCAFAFDACRRAAPPVAVGGARPRPVLHAADRRSGRRRRRGSGGMSAVIEARGLSRDYVVSRGASPPAGGRPCARRRVVLARGRAHAGGGGRVRFRQVDAGAAADDDRAADRRRAC